MDLVPLEAALAIISSRNPIARSNDARYSTLDWTPAPLEVACSSILDEFFIVRKNWKSASRFSQDSELTYSPKTPQYV